MNDGKGLPSASDAECEIAQSPIVAFTWPANCWIIDMPTLIYYCQSDLEADQSKAPLQSVEVEVTRKPRNYKLSPRGE